MFWVEKGPVSKFRKKARDGAATAIAQGSFKNIRRMISTEAGTLYFIDLLDLFKLKDEKFSLID